jgi:hypothetical protein
MMMTMMMMMMMVMMTTSTNKGMKCGIEGVTKLQHIIWLK